jgi:hypothetical protein
MGFAAVRTKPARRIVLMRQTGAIAIGFLPAFCW